MNFKGIAAAGTLLSYPIAMNKITKSYELKKSQGVNSFNCVSLPEKATILDGTTQKLNDIELKCDALPLSRWDVSSDDFTVSLPDGSYETEKNIHHLCPFKETDEFQELEKNNQNALTEYRHCKRLCERDKGSNLRYAMMVLSVMGGLAAAYTSRSLYDLVSQRARYEPVSEVPANYIADEV
jgi:hypothetical protein